MPATEATQARSPHRFVLVPRHGWAMSAAIAATAAIATLTAVPAQALQIVEASDGVSVEAIVSIKEPTRIRIDGAPITDVFGNIHSSHCGAATALPATPGMSSTAPGGGIRASAVSYTHLDVYKRQASRSALNTPGGCTASYPHNAARSLANTWYRRRQRFPP